MPATVIAEVPLTGLSIVDRLGLVHPAPANMNRLGGTHDRSGVADVAVMDLKLGQIGRGA